MEGYGDLIKIIDDRLEKIERTGQDTYTKVAVIESRQSSIIADLSDINKEIYGNGKNGIKTEIALLWQKIKDTSSRVGGMSGAITGGVAAIIVGVVIKLIVG